MVRGGVEVLTDCEAALTKLVGYTLDATIARSVVGAGRGRGSAHNVMVAMCLSIFTNLSIFIG